MRSLWWDRSGLLSLEKENSSDFENQSTSDKILNNVQAVAENDLIHAKKMEFER